MTDPTNDDGNAGVARLIRLAGTRDMPSQEATRKAREAAFAAWQRGQQAAAESAPHRARRWWPLALAAGAALFAVLLMHRPQTPVLHAVASVVAIEPGAIVRLQDGAALTAGAQLHETDTIDTGEGRVAFLLGDSLSLRVDRNTQLRFEAGDHVRLVRGSVYVDSGGLNAASRLRIDTPAGEVRHLGTQFLVTVERDVTRIRVREGRVELARAGGSAHDIAAGDALEVTGANVRMLRGLPSHGAEWEWAAATAPQFDIENRPLAEFLAWIAREHGWQVAYHDDAVRQLAHEIRLHGSVSGLSGMAMLERVELITAVPLRVLDGVLAVGGERP